MKIDFIDADMKCIVHVIKISPTSLAGLGEDADMKCVVLVIKISPT